MAPSLYGFRKDDAVNLICREYKNCFRCVSLDEFRRAVCPTHHCQFDKGHFVLVPSQEQREIMLRHEEEDFAMRENILAHGRPDPGRSLPNVSICKIICT